MAVGALLVTVIVLGGPVVEDDDIVVVIVEELVLEAGSELVLDSSDVEELPVDFVELLVDTVEVVVIVDVDVDDVDEEEDVVLTTSDEEIVNVVGVASR